MNIVDLTSVLKHALISLTNYYNESELGKVQFHIYYSDNEYYFIFNESAYTKEQCDQFSTYLKLTFDTILSTKEFIELECSKFKGHDVLVDSITLESNWTGPLAEGLNYEISFVEKQPLVVGFAGGEVA